MGRNPLPLETEFNPDSPPRNVDIKMDAKTHEMLITWENNCPMTLYNPTYIISITELTLNNTAMAELKHSGDKIMNHKFVNIPNGAVFNVSIRTKSLTSKVVERQVYSPPLPIVRQLKVYPEKNGTYVIYWKEVAMDDEK